MARLITKFKYLKPDERNHFGGYTEYIATREGVEKIDESKRKEEQALKAPTRATRKAAIPVTASTGPEKTTHSISLRLP